jgi:uncharacterized protein
LKIINYQQNNNSSIILTIYVKANSKNEMISIREEGLDVSIKEPPIKGKANLRIQQIIAEFLEIAPTEIQIISGNKSSIKRIQISNVSNKLLQILSNNFS